MKTRLIFNVPAAIEVLTGFAMLATPLLVIGLLLGDGLEPMAFACIMSALSCLS